MKGVFDVHMELTNHCNLTCSVCPNQMMSRAKTFMSFSTVKHIIDANPSIREVGLSVWGEPLLHPELLSIVKFLSEKNIEVGLSTNAVLLNHKLSVDLLEAGLYCINFSLNPTRNPTQEEKESIFKQVLNIDYFLHLSKRVKCSLTLTVSATNEANIRKMAETWRRKVKVIIQPQVLFTHDDRRGKCYQLYRNHLVVLSNGYIVPCCVDYEGSYILGHALKDNLNDCYTGEKMRLIRENGSNLCAHCSELKTDLAKPRFKSFSVLERLHVWKEAL